MKKTWILTVLTTATIAVSLSACGEKAPETKLSASSVQTSDSQTEIQLNKDESQATIAETSVASAETSTQPESESAEYVEQSQKKDVVQTTATAPASAYPDEYQNYVGRWINTESSRCSMEIRSNENGTYAVEITWSNSAAEYYQWEMTGMPSQKRRGGGLDYTDGVRTLVTFLDDNTSKSKVEATGETGNLFVNESGVLYWTDSSENGGETIEFAYDDGNFGATSTDNNYIVEGSDSRKLTEAEVSGLTKEELRLARNEIYARHGLMFQAQDLQEYFGRQAWYNPSIPAGQFDENILNSYEKENLQLLQRLEKRK